MLSNWKKILSVLGMSTVLIIGLVFFGHATFERGDDSDKTGTSKTSQILSQAPEKERNSVTNDGSLNETIPEPESSPASNVDGASLYSRYCTGCHGQTKRRVTASKIQGAINDNVGGMGFLKSLTPSEIDAISKY